MAEGTDVLVVGAGVAGATAALAAVGSGRRTILVDPRDGSAGDSAGSGIFAFDDLPGPLRAEFPGARTLSDRRLLLLGSASALTIELQEGAVGPAPPPRSFVRAAVDPWLTEAAKRAGVEIRSGRVDQLATTGRVTDGIVLDGTPVRASVTILADGPRAQQLAGPLGSGSLRGLAVEVTTERRQLAPSRIQERFDLPPDGGCSMHAILGFVPAPEVASGFVITHADSITVGVQRFDPPSGGSGVARLAAFREHPAIAPYLSGSNPIAGSQRSRPLGRPARRVAGPGWRLAGDSAGLPDFHGAVLRGSNAAIRSGWLAGSCAGTGVAPYERAVRAENLGARGPASGDPLIGDRRLHPAYPDLAASVFHRLMTETGGPKEPVTAALRAARRGSGRGWITMARDASGAMRRL